MKIYTKTGDKGTTGLFGGKRVSKDDDRIESYGTVDELNSFVGLLVLEVQDVELTKTQQEIQSRLFDIGSNLASVDADNPHVPQLEDQSILYLENWIDRMNESLPPLKNFILPGGNRAAALAHVCRTICRRSERRVVHLNSDRYARIVTYLNRLSDYLFILARSLTHSAGDEELQWRKLNKNTN